MIASVLIILFSFALLVYWFRYSCILLVRSQAERAALLSRGEKRFHVGEVQAQLLTDAPLDPLHASLERDYAVLMYLLEHAAGLELRSIEDRLLVLDYKVMRCWYALTRTAAPEQARDALKEMASVMSILLSKIGPRTAHQAI
jgi:hypothetical protein